MARKPADQSVNKEEIIDAAADVLRRNGYDATTMKDIAARVNLTAASLYHHFKNKDFLLLAVLEMGLNVAIEYLSPIYESDRPADEKLRAMIMWHVKSVTENTAVAAAMVFEIRSLMNAKTPPRNGGSFGHEDYQEFIERRDAFFERRDFFETMFRSVVEAGIQQGVFRAVDAAIFTKAMLGAHNWVGVWYKSGGRLSGDQIAELMADAFLSSLTCR